MTDFQKQTKGHILFFETRGSSLLRFPLWISSAMRQMSNQSEISFLVAEEASDVTKVAIEDNLGPVNFHTLSWRSSVASCERQLMAISPTIVVVFAHRLPDLAILTAAKKLGIPTVYYQHGLYIPFMARTAGLFLSDLLKTIQYASFGMSIGHANGIGWLSSLFFYLNKFVFGRGCPEKHFSLGAIVANKCLVYGNYWKGYHVEHYGYDEKDIFVVGAPDLSGIDLGRTPVEQERMESTFCYVAQTLVEDGRLERNKMREFLINLGASVEYAGGKLLIKLHPRSDLSLYDEVGCEYSTCEHFPASKVYVGHYSTMLIRGVAYSEKYILVDFEGHRIPEYIRMLASATVNFDDIGALKSSMMKMSQEEIDFHVLKEKKSNLRDYFDASDQDAIYRAAVEICKY